MLFRSAWLEGIRLVDTQTTIAAAVLLAVVNTWLRPIVLLLTLPVNVLTLGLFTLVINAGMLGLVSWLLPGFYIAGFWAAVGGALIISVISFLLSWFLNPGRARVRVRRF